MQGVMRGIRLAALLALIALGGMIGWRVWQDASVPAEPLPELSGLVALEGREAFDPAAIEEAYILNVWGSWCAPCRIEHPVLMALEAEGIPIYGLNWRDEPEAANAFLEELGDPFVAIMQDPDGVAGQALGITGAPESFVISADGRILVRWPGPLTADVLRNRIYPALEDEARRAG